MIEAFVKQFERDRTATPAWLEKLQRESFEAFRRRGFPSPKEEDWRFTPLGGLERVDFAPLEEAAPNVELPLADYLFGHDEWPRIVFVDGTYSSEHSSLPSLAGVSVQSLGAALASEGEWLAQYVGTIAKDATSFAALNTAFAG